MAKKNHIIYRDTRFELYGKGILHVGAMAPEFQIIAHNLGDIESEILNRDALKNLRMPVLISVSPTLDTPIGKKQAITFNKKVERYVEQSALIFVSSDLPFAINRFFDEHVIDNLPGCSDYKDKSFGKNWGLLIEEPEVLARAVIVLDKDLTVQYIELVEIIENEPNYDAAIEVLDRLISKGPAAS